MAPRWLKIAGVIAAVWLLWAVLGVLLREALDMPFGSTESGISNFVTAVLAVILAWYWIKSLPKEAKSKPPST